MKIGIIGSENSHTIAIAKIINIQKKVRGCKVEYVWGETAELAQAAAQAGQIPHIVTTPRQMLGKVDAVVVDHRHPKYHLPAVKAFVEAGIPTFVDKPFCYRAKEGKAFLRMARKAGTHLTSYSVLQHYDSFKTFLKQLPSVGTIRSGWSYGPCDLKSTWGGVFFYGIHQVEVVLRTFGYDVRSVQVCRNGWKDATAQLFYPSGVIVTMALVKEGCPGFGIGAVGSQGVLFSKLDGGPDPYLNGTRTFTTMFKTGRRPLSDEQILRPVEVLEAMEKSVRSGKVVKV